MWLLIIGGVVLVSIVFDISKGQIRGRKAVIHRSTSPFLFWIAIALKCVVLLCVAFPRQSMSLVQFAASRTRVLKCGETFRNFSNGNVWNSEQAGST